MKTKETAGAKVVYFTLETLQGVVSLDHGNRLVHVQQIDLCFQPLGDRIALQPLILHEIFETIKATLLISCFDFGLVQASED